MPKKHAELAPGLVATSTGGFKLPEGFKHECEREDGYRRVLLAEGLQYAHRAIYKAFKGPIPAGCFVHHVNGDPRDNRLVNLKVMTPGAHVRYHAKLRRRKENAES